MRGGTGADSYTQFGHGGNENLGDATGNVAATTTGAFELTGGTSTDAYAQFGHGGHVANGNFGGAGQVISLVADSIDINGGTGGSGGGYAQVGHGGQNTDGDFTADILINFNGVAPIPATGALTMDSGDSSNAYTQIGHGGANNGNESNTKAGNVIIGSVASATLTAGDGADSFSQIGHGGDENDGDHHWFSGSRFCRSCPVECRWRRRRLRANR